MDCALKVNRRGQEGVTLTTILLLVLGVVVVVVIILGATGILGDIFSKREALPGNLEAVTQVCKIAVEANLISDYCYEFKKIGDNEYINCQDARVQSALTSQGISSSIVCTGGLVKNAAASVCAGLGSKAKKEAAKFNGGNAEYACAVESKSREGSQTAS